MLRIVRRTPANSEELHWNPESGEFDADALAEVDAVVNLCGVNVGQRRWSGAFKQSLRDSRITPTEVLSAAVADAGVETLINASAVGYYGDTRARVVDETASAGKGFLAQLCVDWEAATLPAQYAGTRVVLVRTGLVVAPGGGALRRMRPLFSVGLGARLGSGRQYMSWISLEDEVRALLFAISHPALSGPVNLTGPAPVTNAEFTTAFGRAVNRPTPLAHARLRRARRARRVRRRGAAHRPARHPGRAGARRFPVPPQHHWRGAGLRHRAARPRLVTGNHAAALSANRTLRPCPTASRSQSDAVRPEPPARRGTDGGHPGTQPGTGCEVLAAARRRVA